MASELRTLQRLNMARWGAKYKVGSHWRILEIGIGGDKEKPSENYRHFQCDTYNTMDINPEYQPDFVGDICDIPLADSSYDMVICSQTLEHVWDTRRALSECYRVLRSGGILLVDIPWKYEYHCDPDDYWRISHTAMIRLATEAGFTCESHIINDLLTVAECRKP